MLVSVSRYQAITGDTTTAASAVSALIEEATEILEEELRRPLDQAERTERMIPTRDGYLWPKATPIITATGWTIDGHGLIGAAAFNWPAGIGEGWPFTQAAGVEVTYTGGYVERWANPSAPNRLPLCIERDIATAAQLLGTPVDAGGIGAPPGAKSVKVGDVAVTYGDDGAPGADFRAAQLASVWSRQTRRYTYRVERGMSCYP